MQREPIKAINIDRPGKDLGVEELERLKPDIPDEAKRADKPLRGLEEAICRRAQDRKAWWREEQTSNSSYDYSEPQECMAAALERGIPLSLLEVLSHDEQTEAFVDTGGSRSFVAPSTVAKLKLPTDELDIGVRFRVAPGSELVVRTVAWKAHFRSGDLKTWADPLVAQIPYNMILGAN